MARLSIQLLGTFQVTLNGEPVAHFGANTAQALLAYLAMHAGAPCQRTSLAGLLWSDYDDSSALTNLRQALHRLRTAIGDEDASPPFLQATRTTIAFNPESDYWLDVDAFSRALELVRIHAHRSVETCATCAERLAEAVELYEGEFLAGFSLDSALFEEWMVVERERLHGLALEALGRLATYHEGRGAHEQTARYARRALALEPWREEAHRALMRALALGGQRAAALAQYGKCRHILAEELGVEPSEETRALYEQIRGQEDLTGLLNLSGLGTLPPNNLPAQLTPFVGREHELAEIAERLADPACRLLTLAGPGGSGKTRLALEAAARQLAGYEHGVFFVSLAALETVQAITPTIAQALGFGFHGEGDPEQQLLSYLRRKGMLLLLDNFEHLVEGASIVTRMLRTAPDVKIIVTSRASLGLQGEQLYPVGGLRVPAMEEIHTGSLDELSQYSAVQLFLSSALRARPDLHTTADDLARIVRICHIVEGMPLAITLAAAWMRMLTPTEIAAEIERSIDFLGAELRDVPERQRSMRAVFDHSWRLLSDREGEILAGLSVFRGGFTREAAQEVTRASLRQLMALVDRSLLQLTTAGRYGMHELLRQYAVERLAQVPDAVRTVRDRHAAYFAAALQRWAPDLKGGRQQAALAEIAANAENARSAWNWAAEMGHEELLDQAIEGLALFYDLCGSLIDGLLVCQAAAERLATKTSGLGQRVLAKVMAWEGVFRRPLGETERAEQLLRQSLVLLEQSTIAGQDTRPERAFSLLQLGELLLDANRGQASEAYARSLYLYRELNDRWGIARALSGLSGIAENADQFAKAKQLAEESLTLARSLDDRAGTAEALRWLSVVAGHLGHWEECERLIREFNAVRQEMGGPTNMASGECMLGAQLVSLGKFAEARPLLEASLAVFEDLGLRRGVAWCSLFLGYIEMHRGSYEQARPLGEVALNVYRGLGNRWGTARSLLFLSQIALAEGAYSQAQEQLQTSTAHYRELRQRAELGEALVALAYAARGLGQMPQAWRHMSEALQIAAEIRSHSLPIAVLPALALFLTDEGETERALEIHALASCYPLATDSRWYEDVAGREIAAAAEALPAEVVAVAQERGRARDLEATVEELLAELGG